MVMFKAKFDGSEPREKPQAGGAGDKPSAARERPRAAAPRDEHAAGGWSNGPKQWLVAQPEPPDAPNVPPDADPGRQDRKPTVPPIEEERGPQVPVKEPDSSEPAQRV